MCITWGVFKVIDGEYLDFLNMRECILGALLKVGDMEEVQRYYELVQQRLSQ